MKGKDPETFIAENINQKALNRRLKIKGIHNGSHIVEDQIPEQDMEIGNEVNANDVPESEYILPASNEQSSFVPRRRLPDDAVPRFPGSGPSPPCATPVGASSTPPPTAHAQQTAYNLADDSNRFIEPILSNEDFEYSWSKRNIVSPPSFLTKITEPLHPGWKSLENSGKGACLFKVGADHIWLRDFKVLRKFVHVHIEDKWYFYRSFYVFPLIVRIGSGNESYRKTLQSEEAYLDFLKSEESMFSFNTSDAEIIALGNVMKIDILILSYNLQGRIGPPVERTQWNLVKFNPDMAQQNVFCRSANEPLRILHEDEVHYAKLIWMPENAAAAQMPFNDEATPVSETSSASGTETTTPVQGTNASTTPPGIDATHPVPGTSAVNQMPRASAATTKSRHCSPDTADQTNVSADESLCSQGSITRKRSRELAEPTVKVKFTTQYIHLIVDQLVSRKRKKH